MSEPNPTATDRAANIGRAITDADFRNAQGLAGLMALWDAAQAGHFVLDATFVAGVAERLLKIDESLLAYDRLADGLAKWPDDIRLRQLSGLALARSGACGRANEIMQALRDTGNQENETLSVLGRTHKDLAALAKDAPAKNAQLNLAFDCYQQAYRQARAEHLPNDAYYAGINAASLALLRGEPELSRRFAMETDGICREVLAAGNGKDYWLLATLGEAALLRGELREAEDWYAQAAEVGAGEYADLSTTRKQARLVLGKLGHDPALANRWLHIPRVVCFSGHMIDQPGRARPRFPVSMEGDVARRIEERLKEVDGGIGFSSAACGADILFLEALVRLEHDIHIVLPCTAEQFMRESVDIIPGANWGGRFRKLLDHAGKRVLEVNQHYLRDSALTLEYCNRMQFGLASLKAKTLGTELVSMAVWDGQKGDGPGGTASMVELARQQGARLEIIELEPPSVPATPPSAPPASEPSEPKVPQELVAILFADARHFSKLTEDQLPAFVKHFLGTIAALKSQCAPPPLMTNTWGDGLFMVFGSVRDAGLFALLLCEKIVGTHWAVFGLPETMNIRIGLHAGPVFRLDTEPVTGKMNYIGSHISQAARIEPITPPGNVYASQAFAALAEAEGITEFVHEYVGITPLAKEYGSYSTYHVRRARP